MRAVVFNQELKVSEVPMPEPKPGEALIKVLSAGICSTDLEIIKGYMGFSGILGHEFVGIVEQAHNPNLLGKRVVGEINCVCGRCEFCLLEMPHHCLDRTVLGILNRDGAFAEYVTLPEVNLHLVPPSIRDDVAVFTEPTAAAFRILEQVVFDEHDRVVILGDGRLSQLIAQVLHRETKNLVVIGRHPEKLEKLRDRNIATALATDPVERGVDVVVEATGSHEGLERAFELVRPEGTIVLKTTVGHPTAFDMSIPVVNEVRIVGSRCGPFRPALDALAAQDVEVRPLISATYPIDDALEAFQRARDSDVIKVMLQM